MFSPAARQANKVSAAATGSFMSIMGTPARLEGEKSDAMAIRLHRELYYNTERIHSTLGWLSPVQFEIQNA